MPRAGVILPASRPPRVRRRLAAFLLLLLGGGGMYAGQAAEDGAPGAESLATQSLPFRAALHRDPTLVPAFEQLLTMYRNAGQADALVAMYRDHLKQYPQDAAARTVFVRLLLAQEAPDAADAAREAIRLQPNDPFLLYLRFQSLRKSDPTGSMTALGQALQAGPSLAQRQAWLTELIPLANAAGDAELLRREFAAYAAASRVDAESRLRGAHLLFENGAPNLALTLLTDVTLPELPPEARVEAELLAADSEASLGRSSVGAARLATLLDRIESDHWRRAEIFRRRLDLLGDAGRKEFLAAVRARVAASPTDPRPALELAELLSALDQPREALTALCEALDRIPDAAALEAAALERFAALHDPAGLESFLVKQLDKFPDRADLKEQLVKTLYASGKFDLARRKLAELARAWTPDERETHYLTLARELLQRQELTDGVALLEKAAALAPRRLDLRRELAEACLLLGNRARARELFSGDLDPNAPLETLLDAVNFMLREKMFLEARRAVEKRAAAEPERLDLPLLLAEIARQLGDRAEGAKRLADARALADTAPRYRQWLEKAAAFSEAFELTATFFPEELKRIEADGDKNDERFFLLLDIAAGTSWRSEAARTVRERLSADPPPANRAELRLRLLSLLKGAGANSDETREILQSLLEEDPVHAAEYKIRLALFHHRLGEDDTVRPLIGDLEFDALKDLALLQGLADLSQALGRTEDAFRLSERLVELDGGNRKNWELWLNGLAARGDEEKLRLGLRRLLDGVRKLSLSPEQREDLRQRLLGSYWRSLAPLAREPSPRESDLRQALGFLQAAEPLARRASESLWIAWCRGWIFNRLGDVPRRDATLAELERLAALPRTPDNNAPPNASSPEEIAFPGGLNVSLPAARRLFREPVKPPAPLAVASRNGPLRPLRIRWMFDAGDEALAGVTPAGESRLLVHTLEGSLFCLDRASGRILWKRQAPPRQASATIPGDLNPLNPPRRRVSWSAGARPRPRPAPPPPRVETPFPPRPLVDPRGRLFCIEDDRVRCLRLEDGAVLWEGFSPDALSPNAGGAARLAPLALALHQDAALVWNPALGVASSYDGKTGKLRWRAQALPRPDEEEAGAMRWDNSGATLDAGRFLVYGQGAAILDPGTGERLYRFDAEQAETFPLDLVRAAPAALRSSPSRRSATVSLNNRNAVQFTRNGNAEERLRLADPAAAWAALNFAGAPRQAVFSPRSLLLFRGNELREAPLDLPLAGTKLVVPAGCYLGSAGRKLCFLQSASLALLDLTTGETRTLPLSCAAPGEFVSAVLDGPMAYAAGPQGVAILNLRTGDEVGAFPWPAGVAPESATVSGSAWAGLILNWRGRDNLLVPPVVRVAADALYIPASPSRLVALTENP